MKKIALTSLLAVFTASGAMAPNVIDGNPLYMPEENHFYSVTNVESHTKNATPWSLGEEFGYGITDKWSVRLNTSVSENNSFDNMAWDDFGLATAYRVLDMDGWKLDLVGAYSLNPVWGDHRPFLDEDDTWYMWTAGVRGGYVAHDWTLAGHAYFNYMNAESFNWNEDKGNEGIHALVLGLDGQYVFDSNWSVLGTVEYTGFMDKEWFGIPGAKVKNAGSWDAELGVNYNIDSTTFVGASVNGSLNHQGGVNADELEWDEGFGFGAKFGVEF